jgi:hypothetical protein
MSANLPLPQGAWPIAKARQQGLKPADGILVSFVGPTPWDAHHVFAESGKSYDWSWAVGLEIHIVLEPGVDAQDAINHLYDPFNTTLLGLIDIERKQVSYVCCLLPKPVLWHRKNAGDFFTETITCN